jgi:hypothetical protein
MGVVHAAQLAFGCYEEAVEKNLAKKWPMK